MKKFKVKCIKSRISIFTVGHVYEIDGGLLHTNHGIYLSGMFYSVKDINKRFEYKAEFEMYEMQCLGEEVGKGGYTCVDLGNKRAGFKTLLNSMYGTNCCRTTFILNIKKVIFNNPATIIIWGDDTKTVVKAQNGDVFDPEKGLAMAICKKFLGNEGNYYNEFKKWLPDDQHVVHPYGGVKSDELVEAIREMDLYKNKEEE